MTVDIYMQFRSQTSLCELNIMGIRASHLSCGSFTRFAKRRDQPTHYAQLCPRIESHRGRLNAKCDHLSSKRYADVACPCSRFFCLTQLHGHPNPLICMRRRRAATRVNTRSLLLQTRTQYTNACAHTSATLYSATLYSATLCFGLPFASVYTSLRLPFNRGRLFTGEHRAGSLRQARTLTLA